MNIKPYTEDQIKKMSSIRLGVLYKRLSLFDSDEEITSQLEMIVERLSRRSMDQRKSLMREYREALDLAREYCRRIEHMHDEFYRRVYD